MGLMSKYNKGSIDWGMDTKDFPYVKLSVMKVGEIFDVNGLFINSKGNYGSHAVAISGNTLVDLPSHLTEAVQNMLQDMEVVDAIKAGKVQAKVKTYNASNFGNKECFSVEWLDKE